MATATSIWAFAAINQLQSSKANLYQFTFKGFKFDIKLIDDSLWILSGFGKATQVAFRAAYSPTGFDDFEVVKQEDNMLFIKLTSTIGEFTSNITWPGEEDAVLRYTTSFKPNAEVFVPFWPRDVLFMGKNAGEGDIHISQTGTRTGLIYASVKKPSGGSFLYFQNLTALADYNIDTETSAGNTVGGQWPELGLSLPPAIEKPLQKGKDYMLNDAFVALSLTTPKDQFEVAKGFLEALGNIYILMPRPETVYQDYLKVLPNTLHDLETNKGCWSHRSGHPYLTAYLCDYNTPPEIMVQLAVLLPVLEYMKWSGETCTMAGEVIDGISAFYDDKLKTVMRWLPSEEGMLDKSEEQKTPKVMDSWYLHHPLLNLARMASEGHELGRKLLLDSVDYAIKVAHHFNYVWPVFYKMDTLEVIKPETKPGEGGEKDVAGLYAHVMLQVWELTGDRKYFREAEKAAQSMVQHGFDVLYQANNTMFSAKAMILLYRETKKELYRDLCYLFLANIFKNVSLWECHYGYGKNFPSFFQLFPLSDAPYTAVYEEQESFAGVHELLSYSKGIDLLPSVRLLLSEFVKHAVHRMVFYYPPKLPEDMLVKEVKTGELDPKVWIALEDIHDGWEQSGSVGQEVYGAGLCFGIVPRQYMRVAEKDFTIFVDYPPINQTSKGNSFSFELEGDSRLTCRMKIIKHGNKRLPALTIKVENEADQQEINKTKSIKDGAEYTLHGGQKVTISWD